MTYTQNDFGHTFSESANQSKLEVKTFSKKSFEASQETGTPLVIPELVDVDNLQYYYRRKDVCQVFCIGQKHSYARLHISSRLFKELIRTYGVFERIWDFLVPFGFKTRESYIGRAAIRFKQTEPLTLSTSILGSYECVYALHYVELNHRRSSLDNPDFDPWSIRQTAVYQQYRSNLDKHTFILVSPSQQASNSMESAILSFFEEQKKINSFELHLGLISLLQGNWRLYLRSLDEILTKQNESDQASLAIVQSESERSCTTPSLTVKFLDRQRLKTFQNKMLDIISIFESLHVILLELQKQCHRHCIPSCCNACRCADIRDDFDQEILENQMNLKYAEILHRKAQDTVHLLSDLLGYENAQIAHINETSLKILAQETMTENSRIRVITEQSSREAVAVKLLTIITLIYLPVTVVLNFFSTQLIRVDEKGQVAVISQAWWFAVVSIPLTIATFVVWRLWLSYTMKTENSKEEESIPRPEERFFTTNSKSRAVLNMSHWARFIPQQH